MQGTINAARPLPQVPGRWWEAILVGLAVYLGASVLAGFVVLMATGIPETPGDLPPIPVVTISLLTSLLGFAAIIAYVGLRGKWSPLPVLGFRRFQPKSALLALAGGVVGVAVLEVLLRIVMPDQWLPPHPFTEAVQGGTAMQLGVVFLAGVVLAPLFEEMLFRGYMLISISQRFGFLAGALGSSLVFGLLHPNPAMMAFAFLLGLVLAWVYKISGALWLPLLIHVGVNALAFAVALGIA